MNILMENMAMEKIFFFVPLSVGVWIITVGAALNMVGTSVLIDSNEADTRLIWVYAECCIAALNTLSGLLALMKVEFACKFLPFGQLLIMLNFLLVQLLAEEKGSATPNKDEGNDFNVIMQNIIAACSQCCWIYTAFSWQVLVKKQAEAKQKREEEGAQNETKKEQEAQKSRAKRGKNHSTSGKFKRQ
mmetsp:Transcript_29979/g.51792  ORF Transcript_29979/g.51792 Transcript_29979/m.51792 type:complete len:188 (+) Transcript_29979:212-775(+)